MASASITSMSVKPATATRVARAHAPPPVIASDATEADAGRRCRRRPLAPGGPPRPRRLRPPPPVSATSSLAGIGQVLDHLEGLVAPAVLVPEHAHRHLADRLLQPDPDRVDEARTSCRP